MLALAGVGVGDAEADEAAGGVELLEPGGREIGDLGHRGRIRGGGGRRNLEARAKQRSEWAESRSARCAGSSESAKKTRRMILYANSPHRISTHISLCFSAAIDRRTRRLMPLSSESDLPCPGSHSHSQEERNERKKEISSLHLSLSVVLLCFSLATKHGLCQKLKERNTAPWAGLALCLSAGPHTNGPLIFFERSNGPVIKLRKLTLFCLLPRQLQNSFFFLNGQLQNSDSCFTCICVGTTVNQQIICWCQKKNHLL